MLRVMKMEEEDLFEGEVPVPLDDDVDSGVKGAPFTIETDPKYPGQFRVVRGRLTDRLTEGRPTVGQGKRSTGVT